MPEAFIVKQCARPWAVEAEAEGRTAGRYGLQTMCEGGGMANATIVERL